MSLVIQFPQHVDVTLATPCTLDTVLSAEFIAETQNKQEDAALRVMLCF